MISLSNQDSCSAEMPWDSDRAISCIRAAYLASGAPVSHKKRHLSIYYHGISRSSFQRVILPLLNDFEPLFPKFKRALKRSMMDFCSRKIDEFSFQWNLDEYGVCAIEKRPYEAVRISIIVEADPS